MCQELPCIPGHSREEEKVFLCHSRLFCRGIADVHSKVTSDNDRPDRARAGRRGYCDTGTASADRWHLHGSLSGRNRSAVGRMGKDIQPEGKANVKALRETVWCVQDQRRGLERWHNG